MSFDWKATLATVAPTLAGALSGPLAGTAMLAITRALGLESRENGGIVEAIQHADPVILAQLQEAEHQFQKDMNELGVNLEKLHAEDRENARSRQVETKDWMPALIGGFILVGFFAAFGVMLFVPFPDSSKEALFILLGVLGGMATSVSNFYYGSSSGSDLKTKLLARKTD